MSERPVFVQPSFLTVVRASVRKCSFNGTNFAFFLAPLVSGIAIIAGLRVEFFAELPIVAHQSVVAVLNGDDAGNPFKQVLVFKALLVELDLLFTDFLSHFVDRIR